MVVKLEGRCELEVRVSQMNQTPGVCVCVCVCVYVCGVCVCVLFLNEQNVYYITLLITLFNKHKIHKDEVIKNQAVSNIK